MGKGMICLRRIFTLRLREGRCWRERGRCSWMIGRLLVHKGELLRRRHEEVLGICIQTYKVLLVTHSRVHHQFAVKDDLSLN